MDSCRSTFKIVPVGLWAIDSRTDRLRSRCHDGKTYAICQCVCKWQHAGAVTGSTWRNEPEAARIRQEANADFYRDKTVQVLQEVTVRARKYEERPENIQQRSLHNAADAVLVFDNKSPVFQNLYAMIQGRLTGVTVKREGAMQARSYKEWSNGQVEGTSEQRTGSKILP